MRALVGQFDRIHTALADAGVEHFGEDFVASRDWHRIVCSELDLAAQGMDESDCLGLWDVEGVHCYLNFILPRRYWMECGVCLEDIGLCVLYRRNGYIYIQNSSLHCDTKYGLWDVVSSMNHLNFPSVH